MQPAGHAHVSDSRVTDVSMCETVRTTPAHAWRFVKFRWTGREVKRLSLRAFASTRSDAAHRPAGEMETVETGQEAEVGGSPAELWVHLAGWVVADALSGTLVAATYDGAPVFFGEALKYPRVFRWRIEEPAGTVECFHVTGWTSTGLASPAPGNAFCWHLASGVPVPNPKTFSINEVRSEAVEYAQQHAGAGRLYRGNSAPAAQTRVDGPVAQTDAGSTTAAARQGDTPAESRLRRRRHHGAALIATALIVLGTVGCGDDQQPDAPEATASPTSEVDVLVEDVESEDPDALAAADPDDAATLEISTGEFRSRWNEAATTLELPSLQIGESEITSDEAQGSFNVMFADHVGILGSARNDGTLRDVLIMASAAEQATDNVLVLGSWATLVMALSPELDQAGRRSVLEDLGVLGGAFTEEGHEATSVKGDVRYRLDMVTGVGWMLSAAPVDAPE